MAACLRPSAAFQTSIAHVSLPLSAPPTAWVSVRCLNGEGSHRCRVRCSEHGRGRLRAIRERRCRRCRRCSLFHRVVAAHPGPPLLPLPPDELFDTYSFARPFIFSDDCCSASIPPLVSPSLSLRPILSLPSASFIHNRAAVALFFPPKTETEEKQGYIDHSTALHS